MEDRMKVMIACDGSPYADAALDDLRYAGLPRAVLLREGLSASFELRESDLRHVLIDEAREQSRPREIC